MKVIEQYFPVVLLFVLVSLSQMKKKKAAVFVFLWH